MTKDELVKKKGKKLRETPQSASAALVTTIPPDTLSPQLTSVADPKKKSIDDQLEKENLINKSSTKSADKKRGPGKPKKRKPGDRQFSFWIDEDLVNGLFGNLKYGESAGDMINIAIREYQKKHKIYMP